MDPVDKALRVADQQWRAQGVQPRDRATLAADLRLDLTAAAADGIDPEQLLGPDLRGFARRLADEAGVAHLRAQYARLLRTAFVGAVLGTVAGAMAVFLLRLLLVTAFDLPAGLHVPVVVAVLIHYGGVAAVVLGGALAAVHLHLKDVPGIRDTVAAMAVLLPLAGLVVTPVTMGFARLTDYSTAPPVVLTETAMVLAALAGATLLARRWSLRPATPSATVLT